MRKKDVLSLSKAKARAKVAVRRRKAAEATKELDFIDRISKSIRVPRDGSKGDDGVAPSMEDILKAVTPLLPEPKIVHKTVTNEITQKIDEGDMSGMVDAMINAKIPEIEKSLRPKVELIREEVDPEKLKGFVTKKDFDKALQRVQDAISYHSGGGGGNAPSTEPLANVIEAPSLTNTITISQLDITKYNIVHVTKANSTTILPKLVANYIIWVEDAVVGGGNITINREV